MVKTIDGVTYPNYDMRHSPPIKRALRYAPDDRAYVTVHWRGHVKLFVDNYNPLYLEADNYFYIYPAMTADFLAYAEAFLKEYAPHVSLDLVSKHLGRAHHEYIGEPTPTFA